MPNNYFRISYVIVIILVGILAFYMGFTDVYLLGVDYTYDDGDDLYDKMIVIERAIHSFFEKGGN